MQACNGFVLRNIADEWLLMPTGDNIRQFGGTVLLNEVSAFIWEKLQQPVTRDGLLKEMLDEYATDEATAAAALDALLAEMKQMGIIQE